MVVVEYSLMRYVSGVLRCEQQEAEVRCGGCRVQFDEIRQWCITLGATNANSERLQSE